MNKVIAFSIITIFFVLLTTGNSLVLADRNDDDEDDDDNDRDRDNKFSEGGVNWIKICENAPSFLVSEPCDELVDDDNELTSKGKEVLCSVGGPLAGVIGSYLAGPLGGIAGGKLACKESSNSGISDGFVGSILSSLLN